MIQTALYLASAATKPAAAAKHVRYVRRPSPECGMTAIASWQCHRLRLYWFMVDWNGVT